MNAPRISPLLTALVLTASADLLAQQAPPVAPGDRVRVTTRTKLVGNLVTLSADTCVLHVEGRDASLSLPIASLTKFEVSRGRKSNALKGLGIGFLGGAAVGALIGLGLDEEGGEVSAGTWALIGAAPGAVVGAVVGVAVGASTKTDRWEVVPLERLRVSMIPRRNGAVAIRVSLAF